MTNVEAFLQSTLYLNPQEYGVLVGLIRFRDPAYSIKMAKIMKI